MAGYSFTTLWRVDAPIEDVWDAISESEHWPEWWEGVESVVDLEPGRDDGVGKLQRHVWKSVLPYRVSFDMRVVTVDTGATLVGIANGELAGEGRWSIFREPGATAVRYQWNVRTTRSWMNAVAPVGRPVFAWNHNVVMRQGGEGLARLLGTKLL